MMSERLTVEQILTSLHDIASTIAQSTRAYRAVHRLSQAEFGALLGVTSQAVSKWENERCYPDITLLPALAMLLGLDVGYLIGMPETA